MMEVSLASECSFSFPLLVSRGIRCGIRVGWGQAKQKMHCMMHLSQWLNCPNFPCAAGFFTVGGSMLLAYVPVFLIATFFCCLD
jgi:hypothetical protein